MFEHEFLEDLLNVIDPLLTDADRFKQRGAADVLAGLLRGNVSFPKRKHTISPLRPGSKHWPQEHFETLWTWFMARLERIYSQIKPDTLSFWEGVFNVCIIRSSRHATP